MRYLIAFLLLFPLLLAGMSSGDVEPNDTNESVEFIVPGTYRCTLNSTDTIDQYTFNVIAGDLITIRFFKSRVLFSLYYGDENIAKIDTYDSRELCVQTSNETNPLRFDLKVEYIDGPGDYDFDLILSPQNDIRSGKDAPDSLEVAWEIGHGNHTGLVDTRKGDSIGYDSADCYKFKVRGSDVVKITYDAYGYDDVPMIVTDEDNITVLSFSRTGHNEDMIYLPIVDDDFWFWVRIEAKEPTRSSYNFTLAFMEQNDADSGHDAPSGKGLNTSEGTWKGTLRGMDVSDCYHVILPAGFHVSINFFTYICYGIPHVEITYGEGNIAGTIEERGFFNFSSSIESGPLDVYINVSCEDYTTYVVTFYPQTQREGGTENDAPSDFGTEISITRPSYGYLGGLDEADAYKVPVGPGSSITVWIEGANASFYYEEGGEPNTVKLDRLDSSFFCFSELVPYHDAFVIVGPGSGNYNLYLYSYDQNDASSGKDAYSGDDPSQATSIETGEFTGTLDEGWDDLDMYSIDLHLGEELVVWCDPPNMNMTVRNMKGEVQSWDTIIMHNHYWSTDANGPATLSISPSDGMKQYRIGVYVKGVPYDSLPSSPELNVEEGDGKLILTWTEPLINGGSPILGYEIYRSVDGFFRTLARTDTLNLSYIDMMGEEGLTYTYFICAYNVNGLGKQSNNVSGEFHSSDIDGDGIPNDWEILYGLDPYDENDAYMDMDGDGKTNLEEYEDGTDPRIHKKFYSTIMWIVGACFLYVVIMLVIIGIIIYFLVKKKDKGKKDIVKDDEVKIEGPMDDILMNDCPKDDNPIDP